MNPDAARRRFEAHLRHLGMRVTRQRLMVLELAWSTHGHFTAEQMYGWVRERGSGASRATVYRTLSLLVEGDFLSALERGHGQVLYEHILGHQHHDHMICLDCGLIMEFHNESIERLQEEVAREHAFELSSHSLTLEGHCANCRAARAAR